MKKFFNFLHKSPDETTGLDAILSLLCSFFWWSLTAKAISIEISSYVQGGMAIVSIYLFIITFQIVSNWIYKKFW